MLIILLKLFLLHWSIFQQCQKDTTFLVQNFPFLSYVINILLGDRFPRKNSRQHDSIDNIYLWFWKILNQKSGVFLLGTNKNWWGRRKEGVYSEYTVGARIPHIRITNPFENRTFYCSDLDCSDFEWSDHSKTEHLNIQNGRFSIGRFTIYSIKICIYKTT